MRTADEDKKNWVEYPDDRVLHEWRSLCDQDCESHGDEVTVDPPSYSEVGNPNCGECGREYEYVRTLIAVDEVT